MGGNQEKLLPLPKLEVLISNNSYFEISENGFPNLKKFVSSNEISKPSYDSLFKNCCATLEELDVPYKNNYSIEDEENYLENIKNCLNLKTLKILTKMTHFEKAVTGIPPSLENLSLNLVVLEETFFSLECLSKIPSIQSLNISFNILNQKILMKHQPFELPFLTHLNFDFCTVNDNFDVSEFLSLFSNCKKISHFTLRTDFPCDKEQLIQQISKMGIKNYQLDIILD